MIRNLKTLGLAVMAVLAITAVAASAASAAFQAESVPVQVTRVSNNNQVFKYQEEGVSVTCTTVGGEGTQTITPNTSFTFSPTYSGCTSSLGSKAEVKMNGCGYLFTSATGSTSITTHIECAAKKIEVTIYGFFGEDLCTLTLGSQTPGGTITGSNSGVGSGRQISIASNVTGIHGERHGSSLCGPLTSSTGTYSGTVTTKGENPTTKAAIGIFMD